ncbi:hypothetical protein ACJX0J_008840, partial [Zea mays]
TTVRHSILNTENEDCARGQIRNTKAIQSHCYMQYFSDITEDFGKMTTNKKTLIQSINDISHNTKEHLQALACYAVSKINYRRYEHTYSVILLQLEDHHNT